MGSIATPTPMVSRWNAPSSVFPCRGEDVEFHARGRAMPCFSTGSYNREKKLESDPALIAANRHTPARVSKPPCKRSIQVLLLGRLKACCSRVEVKPYWSLGVAVGSLFEAIPSFLDLGAWNAILPLFYYFKNDSVAPALASILFSFALIPCCLFILHSFRIRTQVRQNNRALSSRPPKDTQCEMK